MTDKIVLREGLTVGALIRSLQALPEDMLVLVEANGATEHLMAVVGSGPEEVYEELGIGGHSVVLTGGEYAMLSATELPYLVEELEEATHFTWPGD
jgi:hypothetical protein